MIPTEQRTLELQRNRDLFAGFAMFSFFAGGMCGGHAAFDPSDSGAAAFAWLVLAVICAVIWRVTKPGTIDALSEQAEQLLHERKSQ